MQVFGDSQLFRTLRPSVLGGQGRLVARLGLQPLHMRVHCVSRSLAFGKRLEKILGLLKSACDASVNVVTLLKIDVLKKIAAYCAGRNGVAIHVDPVQVRDRTLHWHQSLAEVIVNAGLYVRRHHRSYPVLPSPVVRIPKPAGTIGSIRKSASPSAPSGTRYLLIQAYFSFSRSLYLCNF